MTHPIDREPWEVQAKILAEKFKAQDDLVEQQFAVITHGEKPKHKTGTCDWWVETYTARLLMVAVLADKHIKVGDHETNMMWADLLDTLGRCFSAAVAASAIEKGSMPFSQWSTSPEYQAFFQKAPSGSGA